MEKEAVLFRFFMNIEFILGYLLSILFIFLASIIIIPFGQPIIVTGNLDPNFVSTSLFVLGILWFAFTIRISCFIELYSTYLIQKNFITKTSTIIYYKNIQKVIFYGNRYSKVKADFEDIKIIANNKEYKLLLAGIWISIKTKTKIYQQLKDRIGNRWDTIYSENE